MQILNKLIKYGLYVIAFLMPFFFWPSTHLPVLANKQLLLTVFCGLLLLAWIVKVMVTGKVRLKYNRLSTAVLVLLFVLGASTIFSISRTQSFWGMAFESDTLFSFTLYGLVFLLFSNLVKSKTQVLRIIKVFLAGTGVLVVLFLIQTLIEGIFPWDFSKIAGFNPIGTISALAVLFGGVLIADVLLFIESLKNIKKSSKITVIAEIVIGVLLLLALILINHWATWIIVGLTCLLIIWIKGFSKESVIPVCLLVLALLFVMLHIPTNKLTDLPEDITISYGASVSIAKETLFQGLDKFLLGSGPSTFVMDYDLFRPLSINMTDFWQLRFTQSVAVFPTLLATSGILGALALLFLIGTFFGEFRAVGAVRGSTPTLALGGVGEFGAVGELTPKNPKHPNSPPTLLIVGFYLLLAWFFGPVNFSLMFFVFLIIGLWTAMSEGRTTNFELKNIQPQHSFFVIILCIALIVGTVVGFYQFSRNYAAALVFQEGVELIQATEPDFEKGIEKLSWAAVTAQSDDYYRNLSQAFLTQIGQIVNDSEITPEEMNELLQDAIDSAESFASKAITINEKNSQNWVNLADIHTVLARDLNIPGAEDLAIGSLEQVKELVPRSPLLYYKLAILNILSAERIKVRYTTLQESKQLGSDLEQSLSDMHRERMEAVVENIQKAIQLKPNFEEVRQLGASLTP